MERGEWVGEMHRNQTPLGERGTLLFSPTVNTHARDSIILLKTPTNTLCWLSVLYMSLAVGHIAKSRRTIAYGLHIRLVQTRAGILNVIPSPPQG